MNYMIIPGLRPGTALPGLSKGQAAMDIIDIVAGHFNIGYAIMKKRTRKSQIVLARQIAIYFIRQIYGMSWSSISSYFNQDHSSAMYAYRRISDMIKIRDKYVNDVYAISEKLN